MTMSRLAPDQYVIKLNPKEDDQLWIYWALAQYWPAFRGEPIKEFWLLMPRGALSAEKSCLDPTLFLDKVIEYDQGQGVQEVDRLKQVLQKNGLIHDSVTYALTETPRIIRPSWKTPFPPEQTHG